MTLRDAERFKDKIEVSLDTRQVFFLFFGGAIVASLVFVLGVMVGRRLENRDQVGKHASTSAAVDPLAALDELAVDEKHAPSPVARDLAFPAALAGADRERALPLGAADTALSPKAAAAAAAAPPAPAPAPAVAPSPPPAAPAAVAKPPTPAVPAAGGTPTPAPAVVTPAAPVAPVAPAAPAKKDEKADKASKKKGKYTLQLSSFQDKAEADAFATKVGAAGYKPYVIQSEVEGKGTFFRVRLGEFTTHEEALTAKTDFEAKEHIIAYVTRL